VQVARECFVGGRPFSDYTLPLVSLLAGRRMKRLIRSQATMNIEDLPLPFFCISSGLDEGIPKLHQFGSLSRALEATASMPGILPPAVVDRHLVIDGSVLNSLPVDVMWQQPVGRVIAVDLAAQRSREVDYEEVPSGWTLLLSKFLFRRRYRCLAMTLMPSPLSWQPLQVSPGARASLLLQPDAGASA
jgi:NTE family protein